MNEFDIISMKYDEKFGLDEKYNPSSKLIKREFSFLRSIIVSAYSF